MLRETPQPSHPDKCPNPVVHAFRLARAEPPCRGLKTPRPRARETLVRQPDGATGKTQGLAGHQVSHFGLNSVTANPIPQSTRCHSQPARRAIFSLDDPVACFESFTDRLLFPRPESRPPPGGGFFI